MARDKGLEELVADSLAGEKGLSQKAMFGGMAWLAHGNLLCGARHDGMLVRLGKDKDAWALAIPGVIPMMMRGRAMNGWVHASAAAYGGRRLAAETAGRRFGGQPIAAQEEHGRGAVAFPWRRHCGTTRFQLVSRA